MECPPSMECPGGVGTQRRHEGQRTVACLQRKSAPVANNKCIPSMETPGRRRGAAPPWMCKTPTRLRRKSAFTVIKECLQLITMPEIGGDAGNGECREAMTMPGGVGTQRRPGGAMERWGPKRKPAPTTETATITRRDAAPPACIPCAPVCGAVGTPRRHACIPCAPVCGAVGTPRRHACIPCAPVCGASPRPPIEHTAITTILGKPGKRPRVPIYCHSTLGGTRTCAARLPRHVAGHGGAASLQWLLAILRSLAEAPDLLTMFASVRSQAIDKLVQ